MKGLLIKDFMLIKNQGKLMLLIDLIAIGIAFFAESISFVVGYLVFVTMYLAIGTVSFDSYDNGNAFLFTLPISRKTYVIEKYLFMFSVSFISLVFAVVLIFIYGATKDMSAAMDALYGIPGVLAVFAILASVMVPLQIKAGAEKSRIAVIAIGGILYLTVAFAEKIFGAKALAFIENIETAVNENMVLVAIAVGIFALGAIAASMAISISIVKKKEM